jgi:hypothetical protein
MFDKAALPRVYLTFQPIALAAAQAHSHTHPLVYPLTLLDGRFTDFYGSRPRQERRDD